MRRSPVEILAVFLRLGCLSFGGPVAHLAYFREEFVARRRWLDDGTFGECVALTQLLPGPGSSQTGMLIGWLAGGPLGAVAAWIGFTTPSAIAMATIAVALPHGSTTTGWLHGLLLVATAVVASALVTMRAALAPDWRRMLIALAVFALVLLAPGPVIAPVGIGAAALAGFVALHGRVKTDDPKLDLKISRRAGAAVLLLFIAALLAAALIARATQAPAAILFDTLFRVGSLVFGGGHVVLPLLQSQVASAGIVDQGTILAGYAAAQAMPGPLFTISSYVGRAAYDGTLGAAGALIGTLAIFSPSFFLLPGVAPFYRALASNDRFRSALAGANAGVVGLLGAAFVTPIWTTAVHTVVDGVAVFIAFLALYVCRVPPWVVVLAGAGVGTYLAR